MSIFERNVFINCPFDEDFYGILRPIIFTIIYAGLTPRISLESLDSGASRIDQITRLIEESKYAIHDLSRMRANAKGEYFRLNMPLELGLDLGARKFGSGKLKHKQCLILEAEPHRYKAAISDLSGSDIYHHENDPAKAVVAVRNWLRGTCGMNLPGPTLIWDSFNFFMAALYDELSSWGFSDDDIKYLPMPELIEYMISWVCSEADIGA